LAEPATNQPLLVLAGARIETAGESGLSLDASGGVQRVALVGNFRALFHLLAQRGQLTKGRAAILGTPAIDAVRERVAGLALCDPELVPSFTAERFLLESARLTGMSERHAREEVDAVLALLGLGGFARHRLGQLALPLRRAFLLAHAVLGGPLVLCAEAPLADLDRAGQAEVAAVLERAATGRRLVVSTRERNTSGPEHDLVARADWVVVERGGRVVDQGPPSRAFRPGLRFVTVVTRRDAEFVAALAELGIRPTASATRLPVPPDAAPGAEPVELVLELPNGGTPNDIVAAARRAGAPLIELVEV